jgi:hypothetical protein
MIHSRAIWAVVAGLLVAAPARADLVEFVARWGTPGTGDGQMLSPQGICVDPAGNVFVADTQNNRVLKFSADGAFLAKWQAAPPAPLDVGVADVVSDPSGNIYATSGGKIIRLDNDLNYLGIWTGSAYLIYKLAADPTGQYIYGSMYHGVTQWTVTGQVVRSWGDASEQFATGIACAADGSVYVGKSGGEIRKYSATGVLLGGWSGVGHVGGMAVAPSGDLHICSADNVSHERQIKVYSAFGGYLGAWGRHGIGEGMLGDAVDIAINGTGHIYILDALGDTVQKYAIVPTSTRVATWSQLKVRYR